MQVESKWHWIKNVDSVLMVSLSKYLDILAEYFVFERT